MTGLLSAAELADLRRFAAEDKRRHCPACAKILFAHIDALQSLVNADVAEYQAAHSLSTSAPQNAPAQLTKAAEAALGVVQDEQAQKYGEARALHLLALAEYVAAVGK